MRTTTTRSNKLPISSKIDRTKLTQKESSKYTRDQVIKEFKQVGHTPDDAEIKNWIKHGKRGQILIENDPKRFEVRDINGTKIRVYKDLSSLGGKFDLSNKEGQMFGVPRGTRVASGKNYKFIQSADGTDYYINKGSSSGGILGGISKATGIKEIQSIPDKIVPKEALAAFDPLGINTSLIFGADKARESRQFMADVSGLKESEIRSFQKYGASAVSLATAFAGQPYIAAGIQSASEIDSYVNDEQSLKSALTKSGSAFAVAGVVDLTTRLLAPKVPQLRAGPTQRAPQLQADAGGFVGGSAGVPSVSTVSPALPNSAASVSPTIGASSPSINVGGVSFDTTGMTPFERGQLTIQAQNVNLAQAEYQATLAKGFFDSPANILAAGGVAASVIVPFISGYQQSKRDEEARKYNEERDERNFEQQQDLLSQQIEGQMALAETAAPKPAKAPSSVYTQGSIK